jgi:23S rRNA (uracil1939-C5)-methyltransferase
MKRKHIAPFTMEVSELGAGGVGVGLSPDGRRVQVRGAPPGAVIEVLPAGSKKGVILGRRGPLVQAPPEAVAPDCGIFGLCGGCQLQELPLHVQRAARHALALQEVSGPRGGLHGLRVHPVRGAPAAYGYRNKVELGFGNRRYLDEAAHRAGEPIEGRWLGFHAPGRFDRLVDAPRCSLVSEAANAVIGLVRAHTLHEGAAPPWDARSHQGYWRHLLVREGARTGEILVGLFTASGGELAPMATLAEALLSAELPGGARVVGAVWSENDGVADVARGAVRQVWGRDHLFETLGGRSFRISVESFFQTSTEGAEILYATVAEAVAGAGGTLLDLYCGAGSIGQVLADGFEAVVGVEEIEAAVLDARGNAARNGLEAKTRWRVGRVEDALDELAKVEGRRAIVVDPPRVGLHPKVTAALATAEAEVLVYVACKAASLGRDAPILEAGGWRMTDLWTVDLFPQTGHIEAVARFERAR